MKIVFFGTPEFPIPSLEVLAKIPGIEIAAVVSQPDKKVGRGKKMTPPPVKVAAKKLGLKILQPKNKKELEKKLQKIKADLFIVIAYGMILSKNILEMPKYGAINVHASLLPKYRGASPIQETLLNGDKETGISIIKMDSELDHGDIIIIKRIDIDKNDNLETLSIKLATLSCNILPLALLDYIDGLLKPISQKHKNATYCKKIKKEDGKIDWKKSAEEIQNMIKAYTPWPSVFTEVKGKKLKISEANTDETKLKPGEFLIENKILKIGTKKGTLLPTKVQLQGKKEMDIKSFINGYKSLFE